MFEFFRRFFPNPPQQGPRQQPPGPRRNVPRGLGSGFVVSSDGFLMTNAHVVEGADEITVTLHDKREFKAKLLGADRRTDVALLKIDATGLPAASGSAIRTSCASASGSSRSGRRSGSRTL
jgi:serine protease Do